MNLDGYVSAFVDVPWDAEPGWNASLAIWASNECTDKGIDDTDSVARAIVAE